MYLLDDFYLLEFYDTCGKCEEKKKIIKLILMKSENFFVNKLLFLYHSELWKDPASLFLE